MSGLRRPRASGPPQDGQGCGPAHPTLVTVVCSYEVATTRSGRLAR